MLCPYSYQPPLKRKSRWDVPPKLLSEVNVPKLALGLSSAALTILANMKKAGTVKGNTDVEESNNKAIMGPTNISPGIPDNAEQRSQDTVDDTSLESTPYYLNIQNGYNATLYYPIPTIDVSTNNTCIKPQKDQSNYRTLKRKSDAEAADSQFNTQNNGKFTPEKLDSISPWEGLSEAPTLPRDDFNEDSFKNDHSQSFDNQEQKSHSQNGSLTEQYGGLATFNRHYYDSSTNSYVHIFDTVDENVRIKLTIYDYFEGNGAGKSDDEDFQKIPFIRISIAQELSRETIDMIARMRANSVPRTEADNRNDIVSKYKKRLIPKYKRTPFFLTFPLVSMFYDQSNYERNQKLDLTYKVNRRILGIGYFIMTIDMVNYEEEWFVICELFRSLGYGPPPAGKPKIHVINVLSRVILESREKNDNDKTSINPWSRIGFPRKVSGTKNNIMELLQPRHELCPWCKFKHNDPEFKHQTTRDHFDAHIVENLAPFRLKQQTTMKQPSWYPNDWMPKQKKTVEMQEEQGEKRKNDEQERTVSKNTDVVSTGLKKPKCQVCCEDFVEYYHHDDEVWKLQNSMAVNGHVVHIDCYDSFSEPLVIQID